MSTTRTYEEGYLDGVREILSAINSALKEDETILNAMSGTAAFQLILSAFETK